MCFCVRQVGKDQDKDLKGSVTAPQEEVASLSIPAILIQLKQKILKHIRKLRTVEQVLCKEPEKVICYGMALYFND